VRFGRAYDKLRVGLGEYFTVTGVDVERGVIELLPDKKSTIWESS
jgi:hypothetical protein